MREAERQTRSHLMSLFAQHDFHPRTDLGQNFLIDLNIVEFIVHNADLTPDDIVLEIGSGTGGMTTFLAQQAGHVISVEIDRNMFNLATEAASSFDNITLLNVDALKNKNHFREDILDLLREKLSEADGRRLKLVANLPYSVATPVISNLVATDLPWVRMVVTIQLELAQRMVAKPGTDMYGSLSAWLQAQCYVKLIKRLGPTVFWPRPKVNSAVVRLSPWHPGRERMSDREFYHDMVRRLFHHRRKLMRSVLVGMYRKQLPKSEIDTILGAAGLPEAVRAEQLEPEILIDVANRLAAAVTQQSGSV